MKSPSPQSFLKGTTILIIGRLAGRLLGLVREIVSASLFGAGKTMDCFNLSFTVVSSMRQLFAEQFLTPVVPTYFQRREENGEVEALNSLRAITTRLGLVTLMVCIAVFIGAKPIVSAIAPGFDSEKVQLSAILLRWFAIGGFGIILHRFFAGLHTCFFQYNVLAFAPLLLNIFAISAMAFFAVKYGIVSLASGFSLGFLAYLFALYFLHPYRKALIKPFWGRGDPGIKMYSVMLLPLFIAVIFEQVQLFVDRALASGLQEGALSAQGYAMRSVRMTTEFFLGTLGTVFFPVFSSLAVRAKNIEFDRNFSLALQGSMVILIIIGAQLITFALPIVQVIFERGAFTREASNLTSSLIVYYTVAYFTHALLIVVVRGFNAYRNTRIPVVTTVISVVVMIAFDFILVGPMGIQGLALAMAIGYTLNMVLTYALFTQYLTMKSVFTTLKTMLIATVTSVGICWLLKIVWLFLEDHHLTESKLSQLIALLLLGVFAILVYLLVLHMFRIPALKYVQNKIRKIQVGKETIFPETD